VINARDAWVNRKARGSFMGVKLKVAGWLALGAVTGALATMQLEASAPTRSPACRSRSCSSSLPCSAW